MDLNIAILVEDLAAQRRLIERALCRAGWAVHAASNSIEGEALAARILAGPDAARTVILADLHMPQDPYAAERAWAAGAYFALRLRARMACGELPRAPIVALSDMSAHETHLAALALGCDAVVNKSAPLDLPARIKAALGRVPRPEAEPAGFDALLRLIGLQLDRKTTLPALGALALTAADVNTALLAYRRHGCVGLGKSALARHLSPHVSSSLRRGE